MCRSLEKRQEFMRNGRKRLKFMSRNSEGGSHVPAGYATEIDSPSFSGTIRETLRKRLHDFSPQYIENIEESLMNNPPLVSSL